MTSFIWLPPMADVIGIFCFFPGGTANFRRLDYFLLFLVSSESSSRTWNIVVLQKVSVVCELPGRVWAVCLRPTNSLVCGLAPDHSNILPLRKLPPLLGQRSGTLTWLTPCEVSSLPWWKPFLHSSLCTCPLFPMEMHFSLLGTGGKPGGWEEGTGLAPCSSVPQG